MSRALTMVARYCDGKVPAGRPAAVSQADGAGRGEAADFTERSPPASARPSTAWSSTVLARYEELDFAGALDGALELDRRSSTRRSCRSSPGRSRRTRRAAAELDAFLYRLLEGVRLVAVLASPVMPAGGRPHLRACWASASASPGRPTSAWGRLEPGAPLGAIEPLFPRVDKNDAEGDTRVRERPDPSDRAPTPRSPLAAPRPRRRRRPRRAGTDRIDISEFAKVELRAARITEAEKIAGSKKLHQAAGRPRQRDAAGRRRDRRVLRARGARREDDRRSSRTSSRRS